MMVITQKIVEDLRLVCPETRQPLSVADDECVKRLNDAIDAGTLSDLSGSPVTEKLNAALIRQDGRRVYPVFGEIPKLIIEAAIELEENRNA
jgi:uncharacterized protein YbaR (Trm112 family)